VKESDKYDKFSIVHFMSNWKMPEIFFTYNCMVFPKTVLNLIGCNFSFFKKQYALVQEGNRFAYLSAFGHWDCMYGNHDFLSCFFYQVVSFSRSTHTNTRLHSTAQLAVFSCFCQLSFLKYWSGTGVAVG